tara:strand:+ start:292 stop:615 length:324 start_codon:yes stop_codon:yes gene_type:complete
MPDISAVLEKHYFGIEWSLNGNPVNKTEFNDNFVVHEAHGVEEPTWEKIQEFLTALNEEYASKEYQRQRKPEYPDIGDQLDALYHAGAFPEDMTNILKAVKDKYPKE